MIHYQTWPPQAILVSEREIMARVIFLLTVYYNGSF
jgi:hypothetical protein